MGGFGELGELRKLYHAGRLLVFVGAGISMGVQWESDGIGRRGPSWAELVDEAAGMLGFDNPDLLRVRGTDLQILEYFRIKEHDEFARLRNWLVTGLAPPDESLRNSAVHAALARMTKCRLFYTTNYDDFLERALTLHGRRPTAIAVEASIAAALREAAREDGASDCEIVKFHGDLNNPNEMVLSERDYERRLRLVTAMDNRLKSDVLGRAILFIGYSFRDWNVSYLFRLVNDEFHELPGSSSGRRAYIAVADPSDFEYSLFWARNMQVIPLDGVDLESDLVWLLDSIQAE